MRTVEITMITNVYLCEKDVALMEFFFELNFSDIFFVIFTITFSQMFGNIFKVLLKTNICTISQCICFTFNFLHRRNSG